MNRNQKQEKKKKNNERFTEENFEVKEFENKIDTNANVAKNTEMYEPKPESDGEDF